MTDVAAQSSEKRGDAQADEKTAVVLRMVLQQHQSIITNILVRSLLGRLLSVGVLLYVTLPAELTWTQIAAAAVLGTLTTLFWRTETTRWTMRLAGLEETFGREVPGATEDLYIASR